MGSSHPEGRRKGDETGDENASTSAEVAVQRSGRPASDEGRAEVGGTVEQALSPGIGYAEFMEVEPIIVSRQFVRHPIQGSRRTLGRR